MCMAVKLPKTDRTVYTTPDRISQRKLKARATADGKTHVEVMEGGSARYLNYGFPERTINRPGGFHRCPACCHTEAALINAPNRLCMACQESDIAERELAFWEQFKTGKDSLEYTPSEMAIYHGHKNGRLSQGVEYHSRQTGGIVS